MAAVIGVFFGADRTLRFFWRAAIFYGLTFWLLPMLARPLIVPVFIALRLSGDLTAGLVALVETQYFLIALIPTALFALYERRRIDSYGLAAGQALRGPIWAGAAAGIVTVGAVGAGIYLLGGMQVHGLATTGTALALSALGWAGANVVVGIAEEFWFRGYFLQSLWRSIGFWPAAIVVAIAFAALHYFAKPGENLWDMITLVSFSLLLSYAVLRSGTLWFAVGFHGAFDFMQLFVIGTPNGGQLPQGRLLDATFAGPAWLTGGSLGTEASFLVYPMLALVWVFVRLRYRPAAAGSAAPPA
jgi:membrane protease YdiL (CAAX protease family)